MGFGRPDLGMPNFLGLAVLLLIGLAVAYAAGVISILWTLTHPPRRSAGWAIARGFPTDPSELDRARFGLDARAFRTSAVEVRGVRCPVWEIDGDAPDGPVAFLTHGWNDGKVNALARLEPFIKTCRLVIAWDLPGHGDAGGRCALGRWESQLLDALVAMHARPDDAIVFMGWSMGAGVSLESAARLKASGRNIRIVCEAPYRLPQSPAGRVLTARGMPGLGMLRVALTLLGGGAWQQAGGPFDRAAWAAKLAGAPRAPLLVIHGSDDPVCTPEDAAAIAQAGGGSITTIPGARHNDLWTDPRHRAACVEAVTASLAPTSPAGTR